MAGKEQFTKKEVNYESPAKGMSHCEDCIFFQAGRCKIVAGKIRKADWCDQFIQRRKD
jgi:hypothetical protein